MAYENVDPFQREFFKDNPAMLDALETKAVKRKEDAAAAATADAAAAKKAAKVSEMSEKEKQDNVNYVLSNPDLREHSEAMGLTQEEAAEFGAEHWERHGKNENRVNTQTQVTNEAGYTEVWKPRGGEQQFAESIARFGEELGGVGTSFWGGIDPDLWVAREAIGEEFGDPWTLADADLTGWRYAADQPYQAGVQRGLIDVDAPVGQLSLTGDLDEDWGAMDAARFIQDRYEDDSIRRDFPESWVSNQGVWQGPEDLGRYWDALSTAERDDQGILRSLISRPDEGWAGLTQNLTPTRGGFNPSGFNPLTITPAPGSLNAIYSADPYTVPHMQTGGAWEGLGAEYQPGTVEGLGLLAGDPYTGYQSIDQSLLGAQPSYTRTPDSWGTNPFQLGLAGSVEPSADTTNTSGNWSPTWQFGPNNQWGYYDVNKTWIPGAGAVAAAAQK
jgi:hypothetical protein